MKTLVAIFLMLFATTSFAQHSVPKPFWKKDKEESAREYNKDEDESIPAPVVVPVPMICGTLEQFKKFIKEYDFVYDSFHGTSEMFDNVLVIFLHNEATKKFAIARTDGKNRYCVLEVGVQTMNGSVSALNK